MLQVYKVRINKVKQQAENDHQESVAKLQKRFRQQLVQQRAKLKSQEEQDTETQKLIQ
jgi:hypothetical protein